VYEIFNRLTEDSEYFYNSLDILFLFTVVFVMKVIPLMAEAGISGFESPAAEYKELGLSLDQLLIIHPDATFIGLAKGNSMEGVGIFDGDLLLVDRAEKLQQGDVIVANYNGCFTCKLIDKDKAQLLSASPLHKPVTISADDEFQVEGIVTRSIRIHRKTRELSNVCFS
jgi:DNA polymerase V